MAVLKEITVILTTTPYRESDLIVNLLSATQGKLTSTIYGGRKIGKRSSFPFHPGDLIHIDYINNQQDDFIKIKSFSACSLLKADQFSYDRFIFHSYLLEIVSRLSQYELPSPELFEVLKLNNSLNCDSTQLLNTIAWMIWRIIVVSGYQIDYHCCLKCGNVSWKYGDHGNPVFRKAIYQLYKNTGKLICDNCSPTINRNRSLSSAMIKTLWIFESIEYSKTDNYDFPLEMVTSLIPILNEHLLIASDIRPKSHPLFQSMIQKYRKN